MVFTVFVVHLLPQEKKLVNYLTWFDSMIQRIMQVLLDNIGNFFLEESQVLCEPR